MRWWWLYLGVGVSCAQQTAPTPTLVTPEREFVFTGLKIEERRHGQVVWSGTAKSASGSLNEADVQTVDLVCTSQGEAPKHYDVTAPKAHLGLDDGDATFEDVTIVDEAGVTLRAKTAHYSESAGTLVADGPLTLEAQGLRATASSAVLTLASGVVEIMGPVQGRYRRPASADVTPPPRP